jgi:hypothetical protein
MGCILDIDTMHIDPKNLSALDLNLLVALEALLDEASVGRAAVRVSLSQPAMSHALKRLRVLLGDPLLVRVGAHMHRTARGDALRDPVRDVLARVRDMRSTPSNWPRPSMLPSPVSRTASPASTSSACSPTATPAPCAAATRWPIASHASTPSSPLITSLSWDESSAKTRSIPGSAKKVAHATWRSQCRTTSRHCTSWPPRISSPSSPSDSCAPTPGSSIST